MQFVAPSPKPKDRVCSYFNPQVKLKIKAGKPMYSAALTEATSPNSHAFALPVLLTFKQSSCFSTPLSSRECSWPQAMPTTPTLRLSLTILSTCGSGATKSPPPGPSYMILFLLIWTLCGNQPYR